MAFLVCIALTGLSATEENLRLLLISDFNVAVFLALAWYLEKRWDRTISVVRIKAPSGWVLVPEKPTKAMVDAALTCNSDAIDPRAIVIDDFCAMIAARPVPGATQ